MPVTHHVVDSASAVLETAVPDPDVHRVPVDGLEADATPQETAAKDLVLRLSGGVGTAEDNAVLGVTQHQVAGFVVSGEVRSIAQAGLRAAGPVEGQSRELGVPGVPLEHGPAVRAVPTQHDASRVFANYGDHVVLVGLAGRGQGPCEPIRPAGQIEHAGPLMLADLVQGPLQSRRVVGLAVAGGSKIPPHVEPTRKRTDELFLGRRRSRRETGQESNVCQEHDQPAGAASELG